MIYNVEKRFLRIFVLWVFAASSNVGLSASVESKKDGVEVFANTQKGAEVIAKLKKGEVVSAGERSGMYWQVQLPGGKSGFVSVMAVKIKADAGVGLNDSIRKAVKDGRNAAEENGARSRSAVMGVRGLDDNDTAMAGSVKPNLRAVYEMEDMSVPQGKLDQQSMIIESDVLSQMSKK